MKEKEVKENYDEDGIKIIDVDKDEIDISGIWIGK